MLVHVGEAPQSALTSSLVETSVLDALTSAVIVSDLDGRVFLWNRAAEDLYGYPRERMLGASVFDLFVWADDHDRAGEIMARVLRGEAWTGEFPVRCADGTTRLVRITDSPITADGQIVGVVGIAEDISDERVREVQAAVREEQLRLALDAAEFGTWRWDMASGTTVWDERLEAIFGLAPGTFDGTYDAYVALLHPDDRDDVLATVRWAVENKSSYEVRHKVLWPDGSVHWIEGRGNVTFDPDGEVTGTIGCSRDVTARVLTEQRLARAAAQSQRIAERLQSGLGPGDVPDVPGVDIGAVYRAGGSDAEHIGGDWFDVLPQPDGSVLLVIGDVMGRGVDAATTMAQVRSAIRAFASVDGGPALMLEKCDQFAPREWPEQFVTVLIARLVPTTGEVSIVSAGHLPAVLVSPASGQAELLPVDSSPPVGLAASPRLVRRETLSAGSAVLLVTDGLVERPGVDVWNALQGVGAEAARLLAGGASAGATADGLVARAGPAQRRDDITVLLARLT